MLAIFNCVEQGTRLLIEVTNQTTVSEVFGILEENLGAPVDEIYFSRNAMMGYSQALNPREFTLRGYDNANDKINDLCRENVGCAISACSQVIVKTSVELTDEDLPETQPYYSP